VNISSIFERHPSIFERYPKISEDILDFREII